MPPRRESGRGRGRSQEQQERANLASRPAGQSYHHPSPTADGSASSRPAQQQHRGGTQSGMHQPRKSQQLEEQLTPQAGQLQRVDPQALSDQLAGPSQPTAQQLGILRRVIEQLGSTVNRVGELQLAKPQPSNALRDDLRRLLCAPLGLALAKILMKVHGDNSDPASLLEDELPNLIETEIQEAFSPFLDEDQSEEFAIALKRSFVLHFKQLLSCGQQSKSIGTTSPQPLMEAENQAIQDGCRELTKRCYDDLGVGMLVMLLSLGYGAWMQFSKWLLSLWSTCQPEIKGYSRMQYMSCLFKARFKALDLMLGLAGFLFFSFIAKRLLSTGPESMPGPMLLIVIGGCLFGYVGKTMVDLLGGDGFTWFVFWGGLYLCHAVSSFYTSGLLRHFRHGRCSTLREIAFHFFLAVALPLGMGVAAFPEAWLWLSNALAENWLWLVNKVTESSSMKL